MDFVDDGWDTRAVLIDGGDWVERTPRHPEAAAGLLKEARLLPWLAPQLPLPVPAPVVVTLDPLVVRHRLIVGSPCEGHHLGQGRALGCFVKALHGVEVSPAVAHGVPSAESAYAVHAAHVEAFERLVVPLVAARLRPAARRLLDRVGQRSPRVCLVHGDLGPEHIRVRRGQVTGVIDWGDAVIGDPALDLAWPLHGTSAEFADAVAASYGLDAATAARARDWHLLGPWHEVTYGLDTAQPAFVRSGLAGVEQRLAVAE